MTVRHAFGLLAAWLAPSISGLVLAGQITWTPATPLRDDRMRISVDSAVPPDVLHWGVNGQTADWVTPAPDLWPGGTEPTDSTAVNTPFLEQDDQGVWFVELGPFDGSTQVVHTLRFVIRLKDGSWLNNQGDNYTVDVLAGRIRYTPEAPSIHDRIRVDILDSPGPGILRWGVNEGREGWNPPHPVYRPDGTVPVDDGLAVETPFPAPDADGVSTLLLGPFDQGAQVVTSLHAVARWGGEWDTESGRNYNLSIALPDPAALVPGFSAAIPPEVIRGIPGQDVRVEVAADTVEVWVGGSAVLRTNAPPGALSVPLHDLAHGPHPVTVRASRGEEIALATRTVWVMPDVVLGEPAGPLKPGATVLPDGRARFALHAPGKMFVSLVGDFNGWNATSQFLNVTGVGTWWTDLDLTPGTYRYQFVINGERRVGDPYATEVAWRDPSGKPGWRPEDAKAVLRMDAAPYTWTTTGYERPPLDNLVIYEFHIGDMQDGGYAGMIDLLDYIRDLGFTALGPMPVTEFAGDHSWGYNPSYYLAAEASYGTTEELKRLIDAAHARGMAVIKDIVFNHMDYASALYQLHGGDYEASPYFRLYAGENWGFPDVDQQTDAWKQHAADVLGWWLTEYRIDGFRYDATRFTEWSGYNDWGAGWFAYAGKQVDPGSIHIAEHLPEDPALQNETEMDTTWHAHFRWRIREMIENASLDPTAFRDVLDPVRLGFTSAVQRIAYTESHDEERVMRHLEEKDFPPEEQIRRAETALGLTLTAPGPAMIYAGQEFGENTRKVVGPNPLQWEKRDTPGGQRLLAFTRAVTTLRTTHPGLRATTIRFVDDLPDHTAAYLRGDNEDILVAVNLGATAKTLDLGVADRSWRDAVTGDPVDPADLHLLAGEILIAVAEN